MQAEVDTFFPAGKKTNYDGSTFSDVHVCLHLQFLDFARQPVKNASFHNTLPEIVHLYFIFDKVKKKTRMCGISISLFLSKATPPTPRRSHGHLRGRSCHLSGAVCPWNHVQNTLRHCFLQQNSKHWKQMCHRNIQFCWQSSRCYFCCSVTYPLLIFLNPPQ